MNILIGKCPDCGTPMHMVLHTAHDLHEGIHCRVCGAEYPIQDWIDEQVKMEVGMYIRPEFEVTSVRHKKTGNIYQRFNDVVIDCTNARDGQQMVLYYRDGKFFVRELQEFNEKFELVTA